MISNAIKFTPCGGKVEVIAKRVNSTSDLSVNDEVLQEAILKAQRKNCTFLEIQVKDTGIGIDAVDIPKLFKLFGFLESTK